MFEGLYFEFPKLAFVLFIFIACETLCKMRLPSLYFPHSAQFLHSSIARSKLLFFLKWLGIVMLILALMSPVKDEPYELKPKQGYEIVLILDASESMSQRGFDMLHPTKTRFEAVKEIVADFIKKRKNDNLGLVVFGEFAFVASPLTYDTNILASLVMQLHEGIAGRFTALYEGLAQGIHLLSKSKSKTKIAILLTDGYSTKGKDTIPLDVAIEMAKKEGVKVYPIGIGSKREYNIKVLSKIAKETGGVAFGASSAGQLKAIYKKIDELEKSEIKNESYTYKKYYYMYPLFLGFLSLMLFVYLRNKRGGVA